MSILIKLMLFSLNHSASCYNKFFCFRIGSLIQVSDYSNSPSCSLVIEWPSHIKEAVVGAFHLIPFRERLTQQRTK